MKLKIVVVLFALAAYCYADDDDDDHDDSDEVMTVSEVRMTHLVPGVSSIPIPSHVPLVKTLSVSPAMRSGASSPAVMKIPKPGVRFDVPVAHAVPLPVEKTVHSPATFQVPVPAPVPAPVAVPAAPAVMPQTTLQVEVPVPTLRTGAAAASVVHGHSSSPAVMKIPEPGLKFSVPEAQGVPLPMPAAPVVPAPAPVTTKAAVDIPAAMSSSPFQSSIFQHMNALPLPYYSKAMSFGVPLPGVASGTVPAATAAVPEPLRVAEVAPIQYAAASAPAVNLPFQTPAVAATPFLETPRAVTYWGNVLSPSQMTNFIDLNTGGFSYVNVLGGHAAPRDAMPLVVGHPFKGIHSLFPSAAYSKDGLAAAAVIAV
ncbi:skin secretory protein xP2-like [Macrobrachium nipponense]|uniref:skin secretory protein xP2-like n=1 Tax=Macrobrachium nipponense TaxID=159736 RepID=UPI0030C8A0E8